MDERSRVVISAVLGAALGAVFGYLYLTESGRRLRAELEPRIDDFRQEVRRLRGTVEKASAAANESWQSLSDLTNSVSRWEGGTRAQH